MSVICFASVDLLCVCMCLYGIYIYLIYMVTLSRVNLWCFPMVTTLFIFSLSLLYRGSLGGLSCRVCITGHWSSVGRTVRTRLDQRSSNSSARVSTLLSSHILYVCMTVAILCVCVCVCVYEQYYDNCFCFVHKQIYTDTLSLLISKLNLSQKLPSIL